MKWARLLVLPVVVFAAVVTNAASANNGAETTNFTPPVYSYAVLGSVGTFSCTETRIVKEAPKAFKKDTATCLVTGGSFTPGTYPAAGNWYSDYEWFINPGGGVLNPVSGNITITANGDGTTTWEITAYY